MKKHIPNLITLTNLFFGCCAIVCVLSGNFNAAVVLLLGAFICDYADGLVARGLNISSPLGKQLDSLADVVSFGVLPGMFLYTVLLRQFSNESGWLDISFFSPLFGKCAFAFLFSACAAFRLGKFNLDTRQTSYFLGLSTPAATIFVVGFCMAILNDETAAYYFDHSWLIIGIIILLCILMLSELKLLGLKLNPKNLSDNLAPIASLAFAALFIYFFKYTGAAMSIIVYILVSLLSFRQKSTD